MRDVEEGREGKRWGGERSSECKMRRRIMLYACLEVHTRDGVLIDANVFGAIELDMISGDFWRDSR